MTREQVIEIIARGIAVGEKMNPDDSLAGWRGWLEAAEGVLSELADNGLCVAPALSTTGGDRG